MACARCIYPGASCRNCPENSKEEPHVHCVNCGFPIYEGEPFWDLPGGIVCDVCVDNMSGREMAEYLEYKSEELTREEIDARRDDYED